MKNKKYIGVYVFNRSSSKSPTGRRNNHTSKQNEDIIEIPGAIPAIVPEETFWKVQERMSQNKKQNASGRYKASVLYLLSGVIWCGDCGKRMIGTSSSYRTRNSQENRKLYYYECNYAKRTKECRNEKINKDKAEEYVLSKLEVEVLNEQTIPALAQKLYEYYRNDKMESAGEGKHLEQDINKLDKQIANVVEAITVGGGALKALTDQIKALENKKAILENRYQEWLKKHENELISLDSITDYLHYNRQCLQDPGLCKQVVENFVDRVIIKTDTIEVFFKVSVVSIGGGGPYRAISRRLKALIKANFIKKPGTPPPGSGIGPTVSATAPARKQRNN